VGEDGLDNVLRSITPKHAEVLGELARMQGDAPVRYGEYYAACFKKMLIATDANLRVVLRELSDQNALRMTVDGDGNEVVSVADPARVLRAIELSRAP